MSRTNGKPEVIVNVRHLIVADDIQLTQLPQYQDGFSYSKGKMETALLPGGLLDKPPVKAAKDPHAASIKKEDIDVIVRLLLVFFYATLTMVPGQRIRAVSRAGRKGAFAARRRFTRCFKSPDQYLGQS